MSKELNHDFLQRIEDEGLNSVFFEHILSTIIDSFPDHIYLKDTNSSFIKINKSLADLFKLKSPNSAIGKSDFDFFSNEHAQLTLKDEQRIMKSGKGVDNYIEKETWNDGSISWVASTKVPFYDEYGKILGIFGISRDITKRKAIEVELNNRARELQCYIEISAIVKRKDLTSIGYLKKINDIIPIFFSHAHVQCSTIVIGNKIIKSQSLEITEYSKFYKIKDNNVEIGILKLYFNEDITKGPFQLATESEQVILLIIDRLNEVIERNWMEKNHRKWEHILKDAQDHSNLYP